jgi:3-methyladenine DNA glycosylase Mpg
VGWRSRIMKHRVARRRKPLIVDLLRRPGKLIKLLRVSRRLNHAPVHAERNRQVNRRVISTPL